MIDVDELIDKPKLTDKEIKEEIERNEQKQIAQMFGIQVD